MHAVTAVIPAFKSADRVGTAIRSILDQEGVDTRVIVAVDDQCSRTEEVAHAFGERVEVVWNETNLGPGRSRNAGLARVQTPFVIFLDSDDWLEGPMLRGLCEALDASGRDIGFGTYVNLNEQSGLREPVPPPESFSEERLFEEWMIGTTYVPPCSVVWRTESLRAIGGWDSVIRRGDDAELACRALLLGLRFTTSEAGAGIYLYHDSPHRVSRQSSRCADLLAIIDKLLALDGAVLPRGVVERAAGHAYYETARIAFFEGQPRVGRQALRSARKLGFKGHRGGFAARLVARLVGLENRIRLRNLLHR